MQFMSFPFRRKDRFVKWKISVWSEFEKFIKCIIDSLFSLLERMILILNALNEENFLMNLVLILKSLLVHLFQIIPMSSLQKPN